MFEVGFSFSTLTICVIYSSHRGAFESKVGAFNNLLWDNSSRPRKLRHLVALPFSDLVTRTFGSARNKSTLCSS